MTLYTEPRYLYPAPCAAVLGQARPLSMDAQALAGVNFVLDELLQLWVHAALTPTGANPIPGPLGSGEALTTERFKAGVMRVVGPVTGKNVALEAEMAIRELLNTSSPGLRADPALKMTSSRASESTALISPSNQAESVFRDLRGWVHAISGLGVAAPAAGPATLPEHLRQIAGVSAPSEHPHLTFVMALYAERCLMYVAEWLLRAVATVTERGPHDVASLSDLDTALCGEDDAIYEWYRGMRCRGYIESQSTPSIKARGSIASESNAFAQHDQANSAGSSNSNVDANRSSVSSSNAQAAAQAAAAAAALANQPPRPSSRASFDAATGGIFARNKRNSSISLTNSGPTLADSPRHSDDFEQLMHSGRTMKVTLTPDRLRTAERAQNRLPGSQSMPSLSTPGTNPTRRFTPRNPVPGQDVIDEDEEQDSSALARKQKESILDVVNSDPPWQSNQGNSKARGPAKSSPMRPQDSQTSTQSSALSTESDEPLVNGGTRTRQLNVRAKDERKDLASERQINHDLADFFSQDPPPPPSTVTFAISESSDAHYATTPNGKKTKSGGFRSFFGGSKKRDDAVISQDGSLPQSSGRRASHQRLPSVTETYTSGDLARKGTKGDAAVRNGSYTPPPGLGPAPWQQYRGTAARHYPQSDRPSLYGPSHSNRSVTTTSTLRGDPPTSILRQPNIPPALSHSTDGDRDTWSRINQDSRSLRQSAGQEEATPRFGLGLADTPKAQVLGAAVMGTGGAATVGKVGRELDNQELLRGVLPPSTIQAESDQSKTLNGAPSRPRKSSGRRASSSSTSTNGQSSPRAQQSQFARPPSPLQTPEAHPTMGATQSPGIGTTTADLSGPELPDASRSPGNSGGIVSPGVGNVTAVSPPPIPSPVNGTSDTLFGLRTQMVAAQSVAECVALLDAFVEQRLKAAASMSFASPALSFASKSDYVSTPRLERGGSFMTHSKLSTVDEPAVPLPSPIALPSLSAQAGSNVAITKENNGERMASLSDALESGTESIDAVNEKSATLESRKDVAIGGS